MLDKENKKDRQNTIITGERKGELIFLRQPKPFMNPYSPSDPLSLQISSALSSIEYKSNLQRKPNLNLYKRLARRASVRVFNNTA